MNEAPQGLRLQKWIAQAGLASRREAEQWIADGRVTVNRQVARLGQRIDPEQDIVTVDGRTIAAAQDKKVLLFYKPNGCVTTARDPQGRPTVMDYFKDVTTRLFPVGRLDYNTEGLLLLTNDGELANALMHPSREVAKTYLVKVRGAIQPQALSRLREGVHLEDGPTAPATVDKVRTAGATSWFELSIHEGRNRQVRRMCETVGYPVVRLKRIRLGELTLKGLKPGQYRSLTPQEIQVLKAQSSMKSV